MHSVDGGRRRPRTARVPGRRWIGRRLRRRRTGGWCGSPAARFRMGSDKHYAEEAPAHRVTVDGFWMDRTRSQTLTSSASLAATGT